jgi:sodium-dependent dicarboxylate transporter 2/3/5
MLSIAYAASIGGMATLVGSPPNTQMAAIVEQNFQTTISFWDWMKIGIPISLTLLLLMYGYFYWALGKERKDLHDFNLKKTPWSAEQLKAIIIFLVVVFLWSFREFIIEFSGIIYKDEVPAILGAILMFIIPDNSKKGNLLSWKDTEQLPWGILLLFGGGLALAAIFEKNGVVTSMTGIFNAYAEASVFVLLVLVVFIGIFITEIMSNLALVTLFVPIVGAFSLAQGIPVLQLCIPLTLAASCAFMLPVGTPPNAIVFSSGLIRMHQMVKIGFILNIISMAVIAIMSYILLN